MVSEFAQVGGDILTNLFYQYILEQGAGSGRTKKDYQLSAMKRNVTRAYAGGRRKPFRVNAKNGSWVYAGKFRSKDDKKVATRGYVKKKLALDNIGKEVTSNTATATAGDFVAYRIGKNIDVGNAQGGRTNAQIQLLGFRFFGSITRDFANLNSPCRYRFLIMQDKTPERPILEAFFSTTQDQREPVDFPDTTNPAVTSVDCINAVRPINKDRWVVLYDWVERLGAGTQAPNSDFSVVFNRYFKINKKLVYNPSYNTSGYDLTPNLYLIYFPLADSGNISDVFNTNFQFEEYFTK